MLLLYRSTMRGSSSLEAIACLFNHVSFEAEKHHVQHRKLAAYTMLLNAIRELQDGASSTAYGVSLCTCKRKQFHVMHMARLRTILLAHFEPNVDEADAESGARRHQPCTNAATINCLGDRLSVG